MSGTRETVSLARTLLAKGGALESTDSGEMIDRTLLAEALERRIETNVAAGHLPPSLTAKAAAAEALNNAESALNKVAGGASTSSLTDLEFASLEAIIEVTGRPAMRYSNGQVHMPPTDLGENGRWRVLIATARSKINRESAKVGRITITGNAGLAEHIGTGWCAEGGLIVTNKHVVKDLVRNPADAQTNWAIDTGKRPSIDFAATDGATTAQRFEIAEVAYCAEDVDVALVRAAEGDGSLPSPMTLNWDPTAPGSEVAEADGGQLRFRGEDIYVVGHPFQRRISELIAAVYGAADGYKRWSPGFVVRMRAQEPLIEHDCSTLGGNSGSCVLTVKGHAVIGIHMGGVGVDERTGQGIANLAIAFSRLVEHRLSEILRTGRL